MTSSPLPQYREPCGWTALLPPRTPRERARGELRVKYAVVGGGYTGLAAARRLRELDPEGKIAIFEGGLIDQGSSARNSGFTGRHDPKFGFSIEHRARAEKLNAYMGEGFDYLTGILKAHGVDCGMTRTGRILGAASEAGEAKVRSTAASATTLGIASTLLERDAMRVRTGSSYYRCGLFVDEGHLLQPAALVRGLADALPDSVRLYENSPVLDLQDGPPATLRTPDARIVADVVVLATNGSIRHFGIWRANLVGIHTYAALTEEMSEADAAQLGGPAWGIIPAHRLGTTCRRVGANRFMVRSLYAYERPLDSAQARAALTDCFHRRFSNLRHVKLEHVWGGMTALTMNGSPRWGQIRAGVYGSAGCNGVGISRGTVLGKRLAESIAVSDPKREAAFIEAYGVADRIAPEPFRSIGFKVISAIERRRAAQER